MLEELKTRELCPIPRQNGGQAGAGPYAKVNVSVAMPRLLPSRALHLERVTTFPLASSTAGVIGTASLAGLREPALQKS